MEKLAIVVDTYPPKKDGVLTYLSYVVPLLKKYYEITIVAPKYSKENGFDVNLKLSPCLPIKVADYNIPLLSIDSIRFLKNADIVFVQDLAPLGYFSNFLSDNIAVFCHHDESIMLHRALKLKIPEKNFATYIDSVVRLAYRRAKIFFVATSKFYSKLKRIGVNDDKIVFTPFAVDTKKFKPRKEYNLKKSLGIPEDAKVILYLGRMSHEKNVETIIKSIPYVLKEQKNTYFLFVGGGPKLNTYRRMTKKYGNVVFTGWIDRNSIHRYYNVGDIFVFPSLHESQAFVTMEAMASGLALVVSRDSEIRSYYRDMKNCIFIKNPLDYKELSRKIIFLLENEKILKKIGKNARKTMEKFSWEKHVNTLVEWFRKAFCTS